MYCRAWDRTKNTRVFAILRVTPVYPLSTDVFVSPFADAFVTSRTMIIASFFYRWVVSVVFIFLVSRCLSHYARVERSFAAHEPLRRRGARRFATGIIFHGEKRGHSIRHTLSSSPTVATTTSRALTGRRRAVRNIPSATGKGVEGEEVAAVVVVAVE